MFGHTFSLYSLLWGTPVVCGTPAALLPPLFLSQYLDGTKLSVLVFLQYVTTAVSLSLFPHRPIQHSRDISRVTGTMWQVWTSAATWNRSVTITSFFVFVSALLLSSCFILFNAMLYWSHTVSLLPHLCLLLHQPQAPWTPVWWSGTWSLRCDRIALMDTKMVWLLFSFLPLATWWPPPPETKPYVFGCPAGMLLF